MGIEADSVQTLGIEDGDAVMYVGRASFRMEAGIHAKGVTHGTVGAATEQPAPSGTPPFGVPVWDGRAVSSDGWRAPEPRTLFGGSGPIPALAPPSDLTTERRPARVGPRTSFFVLGVMAFAAGVLCAGLGAEILSARAVRAHDPAPPPPAPALARAPAPVAPEIVVVPEPPAEVVTAAAPAEPPIETAAVEPAAAEPARAAPPKRRRARQAARPVASRASAADPSAWHDPFAE